MRRFFLTLQALVCIFIFNAEAAWAAETPPASAPGDAAYQATLDLDRLDMLNLEAAQRFALAQNPSLAAARERVIQARQRVLQARSIYWPRVDAAASAARVRTSDNDRRASLRTARLFDPQAEIDASEDVYDAQLSTSWLLFDGFAREFNHTAARYDEHGSRQAHLDARRLLLSAVAGSYYNAQLARENIHIAEADEAFNLRQMQEATARRRAGKGSLSDVLTFEVQVNAARSSLNTARQELEAALIGLAALMGIADAGLPAHLALARLEPETPAELALPEPEALLVYALAHRPDYLQRDYRIKQTEAEVGSARAEFLPSIDLTASLVGDRDNSARFEEDDFGYSVAAVLSYNLFAGGASRARLKEAQARRSEAQKDYDDFSISVSAEVRDALAQLKLAQAELTLQRANATLVRRNRDLVEKEYQAGQTSLVRLNEAQRDLTTAQGRLASALVSLRAARQNLDTATGMILVPFGG